MPIFNQFDIEKQLLEDMRSLHIEPVNNGIKSQVIKARKKQELIAFGRNTGQQAGFTIGGLVFILLGSSNATIFHRTKITLSQTMNINCSSKRADALKKK